ncbi:MAG: ABC transporter ATP-binding protein [Oscillospiraceae bacterium]|nr:ABC transporter ATP-binding protein [Oscillospiraceae bacterium]
MSLISCKNVCLKYENTCVVSDLSFEVEAGDYLCIVGENGSGKSTLIKAILGLKETASGHLHMGEGLTGKQIGYLPQQTTAQKDFPASVYEVVLSGCLAGKNGRIFYSSEQKKLARENMEKLDILSMKDRCYRELSGGQQQRVLLARALCATKKMLLLDEPVNGLDPLVTADFYSIIRKLNAEGITVIMVSHDLYAAVNHADHILHLSRGGSFFGTTEDYKKSDIFKMFSGGDMSD